MTRIDGSSLSQETFSLLQAKRGQKLDGEDAAKLEAAIVADGDVNEAESQLLEALTRNDSSLSISAGAKGGQDFSVNPVDADLLAQFGQAKERTDQLRAAQASLGQTGDLQSFQERFNTIKSQIEGPTGLQPKIQALQQELAQTQNPKTKALLALKIKTLEKELAIFNAVAGTLQGSLERSLARGQQAGSVPASDQPAGKANGPAVPDLQALDPKQIHSGNFQQIKAALQARQQLAPAQRPALDPARQAQLETLVLLEAARQSNPVERQQTLDLLPGIDQQDLLLVQARGSLALLGQVQAGGGLDKAPEAVRQELLKGLNQFLTISGSNTRVSQLSENEVQPAIRELEKQLGLPETGSLSVDNLRQIERKQKELFVIQQNVRNVLHDEAGQSVETLNASLGEGKQINAPEARKAVEALRQEYSFQLPRKAEQAQLPLKELYLETIQARPAYNGVKAGLEARREIFSQSDLNQLKELATRLRSEGGGVYVDQSRLKKVLAEPQNYSPQERDVARKLLDNPKLFDYLWSVNVGDKAGGAADGQLDGPLHPADRDTAQIPIENLNAFDALLAGESLQGPDGKKENGIYLPQFEDGREAAAKIYDGANVSGNEYLSFLKIGAGTNKTLITETLKSSSETRGKLVALRRDYERLYGQTDKPKEEQSALEKELRDEFGSGDLKEALFYVQAKTQDQVANEDIKSYEQAKVLVLTQFEPQIKRIGENNGLLASLSGHNADDTARRTDVEKLYYEEALPLLNDHAKETGELDALKTELKATSDPSRQADLQAQIQTAGQKLKQTEAKLIQKAAAIQVRLQADQQADIGYGEGKEAGVGVAKNIAITATATVVTLGTGGGGAPLAVALLYGTAAGTGVAAAGSIAHQYGNYVGEEDRLKLEQDTVLEQAANLKDFAFGSTELKKQVYDKLGSHLQGIQQQRGGLAGVDSRQVLNDTFEGAKTAFVTSLTTVLTLGLSQAVVGAKAAQLAEVGETLSKAQSLGRHALVNAVSGAVSDAVGKVLQPIHLKDPKALQAGLDQVKGRIGTNQQVIQELSASKTQAQSRIQAFYDRFKAPAAASGSQQVEALQTQQLKPTEAELKQFYQDQLLVSEADVNLTELQASNESLKDQVGKLEAKLASGGILEINEAELAQVSEHFLRSVAVSAISGAFLNSINGSNTASRIVFNGVTGAAQQVGQNALEKYVDGKADKDLFEGIEQSVLSSIIVGEAANYVSVRQQYQAQLGDPRFRAIANDPVLSKALEQNGYTKSNPESFQAAFEKLSQMPQFETALNQGIGKAQAEIRAEINTRIRDAQDKNGAVSPAEKEASVASYWQKQGEYLELSGKAQELIQTLKQDSNKIDKTEVRSQLDSLNQQRRAVLETMSAIQKGSLKVTAENLVSEVQSKAPAGVEAEVAVRKFSEAQTELLSVRTEIAELEQKLAQEPGQTDLKQRLDELQTRQVDLENTSHKLLSGGYDPAILEPTRSDNGQELKASLKEHTSEEGPYQLSAREQESIQRRFDNSELTLADQTQLLSALKSVDDPQQKALLLNLLLDTSVGPAKITQAAEVLKAFSAEEFKGLQSLTAGQPKAKIAEALGLIGEARQRLADLPAYVSKAAANAEELRNPDFYPPEQRTLNGIATSEERYNGPLKTTVESTSLALQTRVFGEGGQISLLNGYDLAGDNLPKNSLLLDFSQANPKLSDAPADPKAKAWEHPEFAQKVKELQAQGIRVAISHDQGQPSFTKLVNIDGKNQPVVILSATDSPNWHTLVHEISHAQDYLAQGGLNGRLALEQILTPLKLSSLEIARSEARAATAELATLGAKPPASNLAEGLFYQKVFQPVEELLAKGPAVSEGDRQQLLSSLRQLEQTFAEVRQRPAEDTPPGQKSYAETFEQTLKTALAKKFDQERLQAAYGQVRGEINDPQLRQLLDAAAGIETSSISQAEIGQKVLAGDLTPSETGPDLYTDKEGNTLALTSEESALGPKQSSDGDLGDTARPDSLADKPLEIKSQEGDTWLIVNGAGNLEKLEITPATSAAALARIKALDDIRPTADGYKLREAVLKADPEIGSHQAYTLGEIPKSRDKFWGFVTDPNHWHPVRRELQAKIEDQAAGAARTMSDRIKSDEPILFMMRGNTAAGKSTTLRTAGVERLKQLNIMDAEGKPSGALNPDDLKHHLREADGKITTHNQLVLEGALMTENVSKTIIGEGRSLVMDKRFGNVGDVQDMLDMTKKTGKTYRTIVVDVDAELGTSIDRVYGNKDKGITGRDPKGNDPVVPKAAIKQGFNDGRKNRVAIQGIVDEYYLFKSDLSGKNKAVAQRTGQGETLQVIQQQAFDQITRPPPAALKYRKITRES